MPKPLVKAFDWPPIRAKLTVDGVITIVDGAAVAAGRFADDPDAVLAQRAEDQSIDHDNPLEEVYEDQLLCADLVILNKADLMSQQDIEAVTAQIINTVPRAVRVVETREGKVANEILLGLSAAAEDDLAARPSHHDHEEEHDHEDFDSFALTLPTVTNIDACIDKLKAVADQFDILRIKGFLNVADKPMRLLVQGVGTRFRHQFDRPWSSSEARRGALVFIAEKGIDRQAVEKALAAF